MGQPATFPATEQLCELLAKFGIDDDLDWVATVLFARNLVARSNLLNPEQKTRVQQMIFNAVSRRDFTPEAHDGLMLEFEEYVGGLAESAQLTRALRSERNFSEALLDEIRDILAELVTHNQSHEDRLKSFGEQTIRAVEGNEDRARVAKRVRSMLADVFTELKAEARHWEDRARDLETRSNYDPLLGDIFNRRALDQFLDSAVEHHAHNGRPLSLVLFDLDHFKRINDTYGHMVGDQALKAVASIIKARSLQHDGFVARYGGEEIVAVFDGLDVREACDVAESIRTEIQGFEYMRPGKDGKAEALRFTLSAGVVGYRKGWDRDTLVSEADKAMYEAKDAGRNRVVCRLP